MVLKKSLHLGNIGELIFWLSFYNILELEHMECDQTVNGNKVFLSYYWQYQ